MEFYIQNNIGKAYDEPTVDKAKANARLIAAAPNVRA